MGGKDGIGQKIANFNDLLGLNDNMVGGVGENVVEERIVNILKFKKSKIIVVILCIIACIAVATVCLTNSKTEKDDYAELEQKIEEYIEKFGQEYYDVLGEINHEEF